MKDYHTHFIPSVVLEWIKEHEQTIGAKWTTEHPDKFEFLTVNGKWGFELKPTFYNFELFQQQQRAVGIDYSLLSPIPQLFLYELPSNITTPLARIYNRALSDIVRQHPNKYDALSTVPLQNIDDAISVLTEAMELGLKGMIIGPSFNDKPLSDEYFKPLFDVAEQLGALIFIHPLLSEEKRIQYNMMPNLIGIPWETTICATDLILTGFLDRYPTLKILLAHGGGYLPYQLGRLDEGYTKWPAVRNKLQMAPSQYAKRFFYDTVLWDQHSIQFLIYVVGEDQVLQGSDFPFDLSFFPPTIHQNR